MPAFFTHTPVSSSTGLIGETLIDGNLITYGYDGESYYVSLGVYEILAFGRMKMTFNQAKAAFDAIEFYSIDINKWNFQGAKKALRDARKEKLSGDELMFFFGDLFKEFDCSW